MSSVVVVSNDETASEEPVTPVVSRDTSAELVEAIHDDAVELGALRERVITLENRVIEIENEIGQLKGAVVTTVEVVEDIAESVADTAETVQDIATTTVEEPIAIEEPETTPEPDDDIPPGKTHWLKRPAKEWFGK